MSSLISQNLHLGGESRGVRGLGLRCLGDLGKIEWYLWIYLITSTFVANIIDKDTQKVIGTYKFLYNLIFVLGLPMLALGTAVALYFVLQDYGQEWMDVKRPSTAAAQEQQYLTDYQTFLQDTISEEAMDVHIKQGPLSFTGDFIVSVDNYITYKGLVLPQNISIQKDLPLKSKDYFNDMNYELRELERYVKNMVFTTRQEVPPSKKGNPTLAIKNADLVSYFVLSCAVASTVYDEVCHVYIQDFLDVMPVYSLSHDYVGLRKVFDGIKTNPQFKQQFCEQMGTYIQYTNDSNSNLAPILQECGGEHKQLFDMYVAYASVQKGLQNQASTTTVFNNKDINAYKLISIQQEIYNELTNRKLNQSRITMYLQYVEELLKRGGLDPVYVDVVYWFNNEYLLDELKHPDFNLNVAMQEEVKIIVDEVRKINRGSSLVGYEGLTTQLHSVALKKRVDAQDMVGVEEEKIEVSLLDRFNAKFSFAALRVGYRVFMEGKDRVKLIGKLEVPGEKRTTKVLNVSIVFAEYRNSFVVEKVDFTDSAELSRVISTIVKENKMSMPQVYEYIKQNDDMFADVQTEISICEQIKDRVKKASIKTCTEEELVFSHLQDKEAFTYTVKYENWKVTSIVVSDPALEQAILSEFAMTETNEASFVGFVEGLISIPKPAAQSSDESEQGDRMIIQSDIDTYLHTRVQGIITKGGQTLVAFTVRGIEFVAIYDIDNHVITTLFFKELGGAQAFVDIDMVLSDDTVIELDSFVEDPLTYLEKINPVIVTKYREASK